MSDSQPQAPAKKKGFGNPAFNIIRAITNKYPIAIVFGFFWFFLTTPLVVKFVKSTYYAAAVLNIQRSVPQILYKSDYSAFGRSFDSWLRTQVNLMTSYPVMQIAIEDFEKTGRRWRRPGESMRKAMDRLGRKIKVKQTKMTQLIVISMESRKSEGLHDIVNSVVKSYAFHNDKKQKNIDNFKLKFLIDEKKQTEQKISDGLQDLGNISRSYGMSITGEKSNFSSVQNSMTQFQSSYNKAIIQGIELRNKLKVLKERRNEIKTMDLRNHVTERIESNAVVSSTVADLAKQRELLRSSMTGMTNKNPERAIIANKIKQLKLYEARLRKSYKKKEMVLYRTILLNKNQLAIADTRTQLKTAKKIAKELEKQKSRIQRRVLDYNSASLHATSKRSGLKRLQERLAEINKRIDVVKIDLVIPGRITIVSLAKKPEKASPWKKRITLSIAMLFVGFGIGIGLILLSDLLDPKIYFGDDVEKIIGFPATGTIPEIPGLGILQADQTDIEEQSKQIAFYFAREKLEHDSRVFAFTSRNNGVGRTTVLKKILEQIEDTRANKLYIDFTANTIRNDLYPESHLNNLLAEAEAEANPEKSGINRSTNLPYHMLRYFTENEGSIDQGKVRALLAPLKKKYSYIFIDSPILGDDTETLKIIDSSDVVVLVAAAGKTEVPQLKETSELMKKLEVKVLSIVFNREIKPRTGFTRAFKEFYLLNIVLGMFRKKTKNG